MPSPESNASPQDAPKAAKPTQPLYLRLYFQPHLTEIVRLFGYRDVATPEAREHLLQLCEKYGKAAIEAATEELIDVDANQSPPVARLKERVRTLARQMLGAPPSTLASGAPLTATTSMPSSADPPAVTKDRVAPVADKPAKPKATASAKRSTRDKRQTDSRPTVGEPKTPGRAKPSKSNPRKRKA